MLAQTAGGPRSPVLGQDGIVVVQAAFRVEVQGQWSGPAISTGCGSAII
jgi:hypothetical protein